MMEKFERNNEEAVAATDGERGGGGREREREREFY
jgi:hypothetical protein